MVGYIFRTIGVFLLALVFMMTGILSPANLVQSFESATEEVPHSTDWELVGCGLLVIGTVILIFTLYIIGLILSGVGLGALAIFLHSILATACGIGIMFGISIIRHGLDG